VRAAVPKRRHEFAAARACARVLLGELGLADASIPARSDGSPIWPPGIVGSLTHCDGLRAAAVAPAHLYRSLGIDAEMRAPLPGRTRELAARPEECAQLGRLQAADAHVPWDRILFSAKEAFYKAWYPVMGSFLDFHDVRIDLCPEERSFRGTVLGVFPGLSLSGRWVILPEHIVTAVSFA